ncbi:MAG: hypothetical protein V3R85_09870 [Alphaproteobacteria bacterium]
MEFSQTARQLVCNIIAAALSMTVAAVDALLSSRPDLIERVDQLAIQLRENASPTKIRAPELGEDTESDDPGEEVEIDADQLLLAYNQLWQFVHDLRSEGVSLDDDFCQRIESEWSVTTLLTYVRNVDKSLQDNAGKTLQSAATFLHPSS